MRDGEAKTGKFLRSLNKSLVKSAAAWTPHSELAVRVQLESFFVGKNDLPTNKAWDKLCFCGQGATYQVPKGIPFRRLAHARRHFISTLVRNGFGAARRQDKPLSWKRRRISCWDTALYAAVPLGNTAARTAVELLKASTLSCRTISRSSCAVVERLRPRPPPSENPFPARPF